MAATGTSATISAGLVVNGELKVAGNGTFIGSNTTVGGKRVLTTNDLLAPAQIKWNTFNKIATANQSVFILPSAPGPNSLVNVTRNGLNEIPTLHFNVTGNILTLTSPCLGGEMIYCWWNS